MTKSVSRSLVILGIAKFVMVTFVRCFYPYAVYLTESFGVTPNQYSWILFTGEVSALLVLLTGNVIDVLDAKKTSMLCMIALSISSFLTTSKSFLLILLSRVIIGVARNTMTAAIQTFISENVPTTSLGSVTGAIELSWGLGGSVGLPLVGLLLGYGWEVPFLIFGALFLPLALASAICDRAASPRLSPVRSDQPRESISVQDMLMQHRAAALCFLAWMGLQVFAITLLFADYGRWLIQDYGLSRVQLGEATSVVGAGEIGAEVVVMLFSDRVGRARMCLICTILTTIAFGGLVVIGFVGAPLYVDVLLLFLSFLFFETGLVCAFSIPSTLVQSRVVGRFMGMFFSMVPVGSAISALIAQSVWSQGGLVLTAMSCFISSVLSIALFLPVYWRRDEAFSDTESASETSPLIVK